MTCLKPARYLVAPPPPLLVLLVMVTPLGTLAHYETSLQLQCILQPQAPATQKKPPVDPVPVINSPPSRDTSSGAPVPPVPGYPPPIRGINPDSSSDGGSQPTPGVSVAPQPPPESVTGPGLDTPSPSSGPATKISFGNNQLVMRPGGFRFGRFGGSTTTTTTSALPDNNESGKTGLTSETTTERPSSSSTERPFSSTTLSPFTSIFGPDFPQQKTCEVANLTTEHNLRLIPYDIPVEGPEAPPSGCARNEVRFSTEDGPCVPALAQGTCGEDQWVLFDNVTNVGQCHDRPCPVGSAFVEATGFCHDHFQKDFCPGDRLLQITASGESVCACDYGWYPDRCGVCQLIYSHEGCPSDLAHQFNTEFQFRCLPTTCRQDQPLQLPGELGCSVFGTACTYSENNVTQVGVWGFLTDSLRVACISTEATTSRRRRDVRMQRSAEPSLDRDHSDGGRFSRAVIGNGAPLLVSCQPGARTDFNTVCQKEVVPVRHRRAIERSEGVCPRGEGEINGKCVKAGLGPGK